MRWDRVGRAATDRIHKVAIGATDGNIIAAIITTHTTRKAQSDRPIVPGPTPMERACAMVTTQANAANRHSPIHHGTCSTKVGADARRSGVSVSALVGEVRDEAVRSGELGVPMIVVADVAGLRLRHRLGRGSGAPRPSPASPGG